MEILPMESTKAFDDSVVCVDDVSVTYYQNQDCTEDNEEFQKIVISTRNNGVARFLNINTKDWSISDETEIVELLEDFKQRAGIKTEKKDDTN